MTVAGCMRCTCLAHPSQNIDRVAHKNLKDWLNLGFRAFFCWILSVYAASWLSAARSLAANAALGWRNAHRNVRTYVRDCRVKEKALQMIQRTSRMVLMC